MEVGIARVVLAYTIRFGRQIATLTSFDDASYALAYPSVCLHVDT